MRDLRIRPLLRALHRDSGYFVVGLTFVYALSGLAVNHMKDWDPNFVQFERSYQIRGPYPTDDAQAAHKVLVALGRTEKPEDVYRASESRLDIVLKHGTLHVDTARGSVFEEGQKPRWFLRIANWLHLNRGKKAWSYFADGYALLLLFLASSGLFMLSGKKGLKGRGAIIASLGILVPLLYVALSGGP